ncbi:PRC-barrel domain containing protein [Aureimonas flava]|uniref:PRC-barrel domain containing protein n=1 Tax=Aureimonas flava TaxID=2320271 RepID=A0A3A1WMI6_9HYPH|nr:PRC-barrel domain-containing protein [Aureimonas flava]RIY02071.1 PRC-barrel domain containing protein [Aureimonas flava]
MKSFVLAAGLATLMGGVALAQTSTTTTTEGAMAPATATATPAAGAAGGPFYTVQPPASGQMAMSHLASDLDDKDVYGANNEKIGEIEDFVINSDGTVAAAVIEVGGFLGIGEKDVLVNFSELQMVMEGNSMRINAPSLTREILTSAPDTDLDTLFPDHS